MQDSFIGALVVLAAGLTWLLQGRITTRQQFLTGLVAIGVGALATSLGILISAIMHYLTDSNVMRYPLSRPAQLKAVICDRRPSWRGYAYADSSHG